MKEIEGYILSVCHCAVGQYFVDFVAIHEMFSGDVQ